MTQGVTHRCQDYWPEACPAGSHAAPAPAPTLIYVARRDDAEAIWHRAWVADHSPLTIGHAVALCGRRGDLDAGPEFGSLWPYYGDQQPELGAVCPKCQRMAELEVAWAKYPNDAASIPTDRTLATRCRAPKCQAPVWRGITRAKGKVTVFDIKPDGTFTGTNHWRTCPDRAAFQKSRGS